MVTSAEARQTPRLKQLVAQHESRQSAEDPVASYRSTLVGGQPAKGKLVYENHVAAQCVRCHNAGGKGKQVGPELGGIGKRVNKDYLLRSLITPNSDIADGFGVTVIELNNGEVLAGSIGNQTKKNADPDSASRQNKGDPRKHNQENYRIQNLGNASRWRHSHEA